MLRAGPFSDERILRLANRRFIAVYFDLSNRGFAADPDARAFVVKARPEYGGRQVPTPDVLLMSPEGKQLGKVSNYANADTVLAAMRAALKEHPEFNQPSEAEKNEKDPIAIAQMRIDLGDLKGAAVALDANTSQQGLYLRGRLARWEQDWSKMRKYFDSVNDPALKDDVKMERAYQLWTENKFKKLRAHLKDFDKKSNRYSEARYYEGLALFHLDKKEEAIALWSGTIKGCSQDPWVYRCDWAFCNAQAKGGRRSFSTAGARTSLLNRIGYMGTKNPDLAPR